MNVHPLSDDEQLGLHRSGHILLRAAGRFQQLVGIGNVADAQRLPGRYPEGVFRCLPVGFEEDGTAERRDHITQTGAEFGELRLFDVDAVVVAERRGLGGLQAGIAFARQYDWIVEKVFPDVVGNWDVNGADGDFLKLWIPGAMGAGS